MLPDSKARSKKTVQLPLGSPRTHVLLCSISRTSYLEFGHHDLKNPKMQEEAMWRSPNQLSQLRPAFESSSPSSRHMSKRLQMAQALSYSKHAQSFKSSHLRPRHHRAETSYSHCFIPKCLTHRICEHNKTVVPRPLSLGWFVTEQ